MGTTADKLAYLLETKETIKSALIANGVAIRDTDTFREYAGKIDPNKTVRFLDSDGTLLYTYTKEEFLQLDSMPSVPDNSWGDVWNFDIDKAKTYVERCGGRLTIGACRKTSSTGFIAVTLHVHVTDELSKVLRFKYYQNNRYCNIDWGDDNIEEVQHPSDPGLVEVSHNYAECGDYVVTLESGIKELFFTPPNHSLVNVFSILPVTAIGCHRLKLVNAADAFVSGCQNLKTLIIANSGTHINDCPALSAFSGFYITQRYLSVYTYRRGVRQTYGMNNTALHSVLVETYSGGSGNLARNSHLRSVFFTEPPTSIGDSAFEGCSALQSIDTSAVTSIGDSAFEGCSALQSIDTSAVTSIGDSAFEGCSALEDIIFPEGITAIPSYCCQNCASLRDVVIPGTVKKINASAFSGCASLVNIDLPDSVTYIAESAFAYSGIKRFEARTGMTISNYAFKSSALEYFGPIPDRAFYLNIIEDCGNLRVIDYSRNTEVSELENKSYLLDSLECIVVPDSLYDEWITAANWSAYASKIVKASEYNG